MVERRWPTCISLAMLGDEKSTTTWTATQRITHITTTTTTTTTTTISLENLCWFKTKCLKLEKELIWFLMKTSDEPSSWRRAAAAELRSPAGCSTAWTQTSSSGGRWWNLETRETSERGGGRGGGGYYYYYYIIIITWSCDFRFLDEIVFWKLLDDLLCDFPRAGFDSLRLQHLNKKSLNSFSSSPEKNISKYVF